MHFVKTVFTGALLVAAALAELKFTTFPPPVVEVGKPYELTYDGTDADVTVTLRRGPSKNLHDVEVVTTSATGGSFTWTPKTSLTDGDDYALQISADGEDDNYTAQFAVTGGTGKEEPTTSTASETATATASETETETATVTTSATDITTTSAPGTISSGTSTVLSRNTTFSAPTRTLSTAITITPTANATTTAAPSEVPDNAAIRGVASPLALVLGVAAALFYLN
ncbi:hypothetical protein AJ80_01568 [Polytolypa hystricis UAMH7299]|uniref:Yeast cell wall synthesis Kre9/Knh1-like N-terminal domain-containing protein n=1 Tax=Polytolypa hystricis (strain UAMH7299) TaxID=1447883 RepID=A0A2B7Z152_POLH7|nr:hypothetical protein AJ80_01568 [Polytolypa hystricis UAMH7299]